MRTQRDNIKCPPAARESSRWDRFWFGVVQFLGVVQEFILATFVREPCWRSSDGKTRRIRDLDKHHLRNIHNLLSEHGDTTSREFREILDEVQRRRAA